MKLKELAKNTIGVTNDYNIFETEILLSHINNLNNDINIIEEKILSIMKDYPTYIETIKGISKLSAAIIISEFGNIDLFKSSDSLLSFAGLDPSINQSGTMSSTGKLVKRGSKHLRAALMNASMGVMTHNPKYYNYYLKKKNEGKHHRVVLVHIAKKLLRVIYHLETKKEKFNPNY